MTVGRLSVGHPVDVASGVQFTAAHDVDVAGTEPLIFRRVYNTSYLDRPPSALGPGWSHCFEVTLTRDLVGYEFDGHDGERIHFDDRDGELERTGSLLNASESMELRLEDKKLVVYHWHSIEEPVQKYVFDPADGDKMGLRSRELPSGHALVVQYDAALRVASVTQRTEGRRLQFFYGEDGLLAELHLTRVGLNPEPGIVVARYAYDAQRRLQTVYDALGKAQEYRYDAHGRLVLERDRRGGTYYMKYDSEGRCIETTGDEGRDLRRFSYESGRVTRVWDSLDRETLYEYNASGQVVRKVLPNGAVYASQFDEVGRLAAEIDPLGATTSYEYDARGNLVGKTYPGGAVQAFTYDNDHQPTTLTEPDGAVWRLEYQRGALVEVVDRLKRKVEYRRNARNDVIAAMTASGRHIGIQTDEGWREETISDDYGIVSARKLDIYFNPVEISDARGPIERRTYDVLGRLIESAYPNGTQRSFQYDAEGAMIRVVDARGKERTARYSSYGECMSETDPLGRTHTYTWDSERRLTSIRNPRGEVARFEYDSVGNLVKIDHFDGTVERAGYDLAGRIVRREKADGTILEFVRDLAGNEVQTIGNGRSIREMAYDVCGSPVEARTADSVVAFEYEVGGRIRAEIQNGQRIEYAYDGRGFLVRRSWSDSSIGPLLLEHDKRGRLLSFRNESSGSQSFRYDASDLLTERQLGPVREELQYDLRSRLRHQRIGGVGSRTYQYDGEGALVDMLDSLRGRRTWEYDADEQLIRSLSPTLGEHRYEYDGSGNLIARDQEQLRYGRGNRLSSAGGVSFERDSVGQLLTRADPTGLTRYHWDPLGQLVRVSHPDGAETTFGYDALGRRLFKEHAGRRTTYVWSGDDLLAERKDGQVTEYAMWNAWPEAFWEDGRIRHVVTSHQGVPQEILDEEGRVIWKGEFDDFGKLVSESGSTTTRLRLPGQLADPETGLHYNRYRYYSPDEGQFISPDPIGFAGAMNFYRFAANAISWIDPLGLRCPDNACGKGKKRGPKTDPDAPHNKKIRLTADKLVAEGNEIVAGGQTGKKEAVIATPGGNKESRRPDIIYRTPDGELRGINVGLTEADGVTPVARERNALADLNGPGQLPTTFVPYGKR